MYVSAGTPAQEKILVPAARSRDAIDFLSRRWISENTARRAKKKDRDLLASLGQASPAKSRLAASMDKTIRLQLEAPSDFWLDFS